MGACIMHVGVVRGCEGGGPYSGHHNHLYTASSFCICPMPLPLLPAPHLQVEDPRLQQLSSISGSKEIVSGAAVVQ